MNKENTKPKKAVVWTSEQEELLAEWAEKAKCYRWLHSRAEKKYRGRNFFLTIPVIILSTLTGTANFAMDSFVPEEKKQTAMAIVGSVNIFAGILTTLQNYLRYAELMESNRSCEVLWSKFGRNIEVELALEPGRRKPAEDFMNICRAEYDGLIEQSPSIDDDIILQFKANFKNADINKPDICNGLDKCTIYKPPRDQRLMNLAMKTGHTFANASKFKDITKKKILQGNIKNHSQKHAEENKKEMKEIHGLGKVRQFKEKIKETPHKSMTPEEEIKHIFQNENPEDEDKEEQVPESPEPEPEPEKADEEELIPESPEPESPEPEKAEEEEVVPESPEPQPEPESREPEPQPEPESPEPEPEPDIETGFLDGIK